jgi:hypothetical protein
MHAERFFTPCSHGPFVGGALFRFGPIGFPTSNTTGSALEWHGDNGRPTGGVPGENPSWSSRYRIALKICGVNGMFRELRAKETDELGENERNEPYLCKRSSASSSCQS